MSDENNAAEVIQSLVAELNRLKDAATMLEEARAHLAAFEELQDKRIANLVGQISELKSNMDKHLSERPSFQPKLDELFANHDRQEKWLKIEMENIDQRFSKIENLRTTINKTTENTEQITNDLRSARHLNIWLISWLSLLTLAFIILLFMRS